MESLKPIEAWFAQQGWKPALFQRQTWKASLEGASGLIQVPTGSGKTYAAVLGPIAKMLAEKSSKRGVRLLYITPLRALSRDLAVSIHLPISEMNWPIRVGTRNGDTTSAERTKQLRNPPEILITTPESLSVLIGNQKVLDLFKNLETVVLDEWHELMGSK